MRTMQCRQLTGWILRTFKARDKCVMLTLFKSLVLPRLEYGCQLWSPTLVNQINAIENICKESLQNTSLACIHFHMSSGVARGGQGGGGNLPPGAARRGAPKSCPKNLYMEKFLKI